MSLGTSLGINDSVTLAPATSGPLSVGQFFMEWGSELTGPVDLVVTGSTSIEYASAGSPRVTAAGWWPVGLGE